MIRFRLQTLMRLRIADRDERRAKLAEAYQAEQILRGRIDEFERQIQEIKRLVRDGATPGQIDVDRLLQMHRYELLLAAQKKAVEQQLEQVHQETEKRREALVEADRQVRVLEKLRDKRQAEHAILEDRREMKTLDEIALRMQRER